mmetsp:Transcript_25790/g.83292  ORF Transcript_25790/g.83292 Transcript_25790/m.83292 type:complete len:219 (+) Transcript_25790:533-1189(+)
MKKHGAAVRKGASPPQRRQLRPACAAPAPALAVVVGVGQARWQVWQRVPPPVGPPAALGRAGCCCSTSPHSVAGPACPLPRRGVQAAPCSPSAVRRGCWSGQREAKAQTSAAAPRSICTRTPLCSCTPWWRSGCRRTILGHSPLSTHLCHRPLRQQLLCDRRCLNHAALSQTAVAPIAGRDRGELQLWPGRWRSTCVSSKRLHSVGHAQPVVRLGSSA